MIRRAVVFLSLVGTAFGLPYAWSRSDSIKSRLSDTWQRDREATGFVANNRTPQIPPLAVRTAAKTDLPTGAALYSMDETLRFNVTPEWVYQRWPRKSTSLSELDLFGVRVPLVTGTEIDDVAGSLTYYFNRHRQVERLELHGQTGNPSRLMALASQRFQMLPQRSVVEGQQVLEFRWNNRPISRLMVEPVSVVRSEAPHSNFRVELIVQRPGTSPYLKAVGPAAPRRNLTFQGLDSPF